MKEEYHYFRIKMAFTSVGDNDRKVVSKIEDLVMATTYTEAEQVAYSLAEGKDNVTYEIIKTKISEVAYNDTFTVDSELTNGLVTYYFEEEADTEVGLYQVSVVNHMTDEKSGKRKDSTDILFMPAKSSSDAISNTHEYLKYTGVNWEYSIRNVRYDKAQSILVPPEIHKLNL